MSRLNIFYFIPFAVAFGLAVSLTPAIKKLAEKFKIVDYPAGERKIHQKPIPLLGGLAIFLAVTVSIVIFWLSGNLLDKKITTDYILAIIIGGLILMIGGLLDDKYNLEPRQQIIFPALAALVIIFSGIKISFVSHPLGGVLNIPTAFGVIITFIWVLGMMYTTKLLDGLDGLATGVTLIGAVIIFIVSLFWDVFSSGTSILALILAGAAAGFLIFNFYPAKIFLGEGGSLFLGFMLGVLAIISGSKIAAALLVMGIPILDVFWVIFRRLKEKKPISLGDQNHLHFQLLKKGFSQPQAVMFLYLVAGTFGFSSLFLNTLGKIIALIILVTVMAGLIKFLTSGARG